MRGYSSATQHIYIIFIIVNKYYIINLGEL